MKGTTRVFWIKRDSGAGKSVLMKHSVKRMRKHSPNDLVVSFLFGGQGIPLEKTLLDLLSFPDIEILSSVHDFGGCIE